MIIEIFNSAFLRIDDDISLFLKKSNEAMRKTLSEKNIIEFLTFKRKINDDVNEMSNNIFQ